MLANPKNCEMVMLAHDGLGRLKLDGRCELELRQQMMDEIDSDDDEGTDGKGVDDNSDDNNKQNGQVSAEKNGPKTTTVITGYRKHPRLRTLPPQWVQPRTPRMCYNDT